VIGSTVCNFDLTLDAQWNYNCRPGEPSCPVDGTDTLNAQANLTSGDVCPVFTVDSSLSGTLGAFVDSSFSEANTAFLANNEVFLKATLSSDVTLQNIQVDGLVVHKDGSSVTVALPGGGFNDVLGSTTTYTSTYGLPMPEVGFSFTASYGPDSQSIFQAPDPVQTFTIEVDLVVTYVTSFKRDVMQETIKLSKTLVLDASHA